MSVARPVLRKLAPLAVLTLFGSALPGVAHAGTADVSEAEVASLVLQAQTFLDERNDFLVVPSQQTDTSPLVTIPLVNSYADKLAVSETILADRREDFEAWGEAYTGADTAVTLVDYHQSGETLLVVVTERTSLAYAKLNGDEPPSSDYSIDHTLTFERTGSGDWALAGDQVEAGALPPVTVAELPATTQAAESRGHRSGH